MTCTNRARKAKSADHTHCPVPVPQGDEASRSDQPVGTGRGPGAGDRRCRRDAFAPEFALSRLRTNRGQTRHSAARQPARRPARNTETTALGAAYLAGLKAGLCPPPAEFQKSWALERRFTPAMDDRTRNAKYARWGRAVAATMTV